VPARCGDENKPPEDNTICGIDRRPLLPITLIGSTLLGGICMFGVQLPLLRNISGGHWLWLSALFMFLYVVTLVCMFYCALSDPGMLRPEVQASAGLPNGSLPKRAHKTWLYSLPIRRYDHYCKWLTNCIGLLNHREFVVLVVGLVTIGVAGAAVDVFLAFTDLFWGTWLEWLAEVLILAHLAYSIGMLTLAGPVLGLHIGFISRNELAQEWKNDMFYVVRTPEGDVLSVGELSDEEFNKNFDNFLYDRSRNEFDQGIEKNCMDFWCTPRWTADQLGDF